MNDLTDLLAHVFGGFQSPGLEDEHAVAVVVDADLRVGRITLIFVAKPAIITLGVFIFLSEWSSFVWPLIVLSDWKKYPVTVGISLFRDVNSINWPSVFAGSTIVSFPIIFLFILAQKYIVGGISLSGLKG